MKTKWRINKENKELTEKINRKIMPLGADICRIEEKLNAITEYLDIHYETRIYEKTSDIIRIDQIAVDNEGKKPMKRTKWNKES